MAIVVGASTGIGAATGTLFAELGATVVLASRDLRALEVYRLLEIEVELIG